MAKAGTRRQSSRRTYANFGAALQAYRESVSSRLQQINPLLPRMQLSAAALLDAMRKTGYSLSPGAYSEIEAGHTLPREPQRFLDAVCPALAIERESLDWYILRQYLTHDIVEQKLGPIAAAWIELDEDKIRQRMEEEEKQRGE